MRLVAYIGAAVLACATVASATDAPMKCAARKLKIAGKYGFCRLHRGSIAERRGLQPDYSKCDSNYVHQWAAAELSAGGACWSNGDAARIQDAVTLHTDDVGLALIGQLLPGPSRRMRTGQAACYDAAGATITCTGTGQDGDDQRGIARSYVDNGDGTITDRRTGLMWEKKSDDGSIHDKNATYSWDDAFAVFLPEMNDGSGFAGHFDWRVPNRSELESLADLGRKNPAIDPIFNNGCSPDCTVLTCSCTSYAWHYWTSTSNVWNTSTAWLVYFTDGDVNAFDKATTLHHVRAVRGGS